VYSDFYEIPLPALRFEKVEETHRKVNDTEETTLDHVRSTKQKEKHHEKTTYHAHQNSKRKKLTMLKKGTTLPRTTRRQTTLKPTDHGKDLRNHRLFK
jgi:hypothetical protein